MAALMWLHESGVHGGSRFLAEVNKMSNALHNLRFKHLSVYSSNSKLQHVMYMVFLATQHCCILCAMRLHADVSDILQHVWIVLWMSP